MITKVFPGVGQVVSIDLDDAPVDDAFLAKIGRYCPKVDDFTLYNPCLQPHDRHMKNAEDELHSAPAGCGAFVRAVEVMNRRMAEFTESLPCPECSAECQVEQPQDQDDSKQRSRSMRTRGGEFELEEPWCYCRPCRRSIFPSADG